MINVYIVLWILFAHWFADFVCQPDRWARNKSKSNAVLASHVLLYSVLMSAAFAIVSVGLWAMLVVFVITFVCHFATDYVTSRVTSHLYAKEDYHNFFTVIGIDQFLHYTQLLLTYHYLTQ